MNRQTVFSLALLLIEVTFTVFIAGIVVPSLLWPQLAAKEDLTLVPLRAIHIAGFTLSYTAQSVEFAILGSLVGALVAVVLNFGTAARRNNTSPRRTILRAALSRH